MTKQLKGAVKAIKYPEGFMFITHEATGEDYFAHRTAVQVTGQREWGDIEVGDHVTFTPIDGPKGLRAIEVRVG